MTEPNLHAADLDAVTGADLTTTTFSMSTTFGRGYDQHEVDSFVARSAATVDHLRGRLRAATQQIEDLQAQVERSGRSRDVTNAMKMLTTAQRTADTTVAEADAYSTKVMAEARDLYEDARRNAATLEQETEAKARSVYEDAVTRSAALERETQERVAELTMTAVTAQQELDAQTAYLRTLRDATRTQMEAFLEGLLDRVADEYGRAHPLAVEAARETPRRPRRSGKSNGRPTIQAGRTTGSAARVAGQPGRTRGTSWDVLPSPRVSSENGSNAVTEGKEVRTD